jgi:ankyrin repeat protein
VGKPHPQHDELLKRLFSDLAAAGELLRAHPELVHSCDEMGETALHYATAEANLEAARLLLQHNADVHARDHSGKPPLHNAAIAGHAEMVKFLLTRGADPKLQDENFDTALHYAVLAQTPSPAVLDALVAAGADVNAPNNLDQTPIDLAVEADREDLAERLRRSASPG